MTRMIRPRSPWAAALIPGLLALGSILTLCRESTAQDTLKPPGPESFAKPPKTPIEFWDAADYLVRTGQASLAVPYLQSFLRSKPDDAALLEIRDRYGVGSVLRLQDDPATQPLTRPILELVSGASRRSARDPERIKQAIGALTKSRAEQKYALERLREAGPYAVPPLLSAIQDPSMSRESRSQLVDGLGRLDRSAVPALIAALESPDSTVGADAAHALGMIGDPRAIPFLTGLAAGKESGAVGEAARRALRQITGRPFEAQSRTPVRVLADESRRYQKHAVQFPPSDQVEVWVWSGDNVAPRSVKPSEAETSLGLRFARESLRLDPTDRQAQIAFVSLALEDAAKREGAFNLPSRDSSGAFASALSAGPAVLSDVLRQAIADGHSELAVAAALALGRVTDRNALDSQAGSNPLVEALSAPDRRVQYAAATALTSLSPAQPFPGASRVVPTLARFVANQEAPKAVVIDGNFSRGNGTGGAMRALGYDARVAQTGPEGFELATDSADVEVILIDPSALQDPWRAAVVVANLRADARTAGVPIIVTGDLGVRDRYATWVVDYPRVTFLQTPGDPGAFKPQFEREMARLGARPLSAAERDGFAQGAAAQLAQLAARPGTLFARDLALAEPALISATNNDELVGTVVNVLGEIPGVNPQRKLADLLLDPSQNSELRVSAANQLSRSLQRFGPLLTSEQEQRLASALDNQQDPSLRTAFASVIGALKPQAGQSGRRLQSFERPPQSTPAPRASAPDAGEPTSAPAAPEPPPTTPNPPNQP